MPSLVAATLCLAAVVAFLYYGLCQAAVGVAVGYVLSTGYFLGLRRSVWRAGKGTAGGAQLKVFAFLRFFLIGVVLLGLGFFLPRSLWGVLVSFSIVFPAFLLEMMRR